MLFSEHTIAVSRLKEHAVKWRAKMAGNRRKNPGLINYRTSILIRGESCNRFFYRAIIDGLRKNSLPLQTIVLLCPVIEIIYFGKG